MSPSKRDTFLAMLERGKTMLHLDARVDGVDVPPHVATDPHLRLNFSYKFFLDTFEIDEAGVRASLSFNGRPHLCVIPWNAIFGMASHVSEDFQIWPENMPRELLEQAAALAEAQQKAKLERVDLDADPDLFEEDEDEEAEVIGGAIRRVGHLRVIK